MSVSHDLKGVPNRRVVIAYAVASVLWLVLAQLLRQALPPEAAEFVWPAADLLFVAGSIVLMLRLLESFEKSDAQREFLDRHSLALATEMEAIFEVAPVGIVLIREGRVEHANPTAAAIGKRDNELVGAVIGEGLVTDPAECERIWTEAHTAFKQNRSYTTEVEQRRKDGSPGWIRLSARALDPAAPTGASVWIIEDIDALKRSEDQLRIAEQRWQFALEGAEQGVWDWDMVRHRIWYSPRWKAMLGHDEADIGNGEHEWLNRVHPADRSATIEIMERHCRGEMPLLQCEFRLRHKNGEYLWIQSRGKVVEWDGEGRPVRVTGVNTDITERKSAEEAARSTREIYQDLVNAMPMGFYLIDREGRLLFANRFMVDMFEPHGQQRPVGKSVYEGTPNRDLRVAQERDRQVMESGQPMTTIEEYLVADSSEKHWLEITRVPVRNSNNSITGLQGVIRDVTEQVRAEEQRRLTSLVFESSHQGIIVHGAQGNILAVNRALCRISGYTEAELIGSRSDILSSGRHDAQFYESLNRRLTETGHWEGEMWQRRANGEIYPAYVSVDNLHDRERGSTNAVVMIADISERKAAERALRESEELYRSLGAALPMGLFRINREGRIVFGNKYMARMMGRESENDLIGLDMYAHTPERNRADALAQHWRVVDEGVAWTMVEEHEVPGLNQSRYQEITRIPVRDEEGRITGEQGVFRDVTEQVLAMQQLRLTSLVFESTYQAVIICDADDNILKVNPAFTRITGYTPEETLGRKSAFMKSGFHDDRFFAAINAELAVNGHWEGELWARRKNGEAFPMQLTVDALRDENGRLANVVTMYADISERKAQEQEIRRLAQHDALTDLPNRVLLRDRLGLALESARRGATRLAVMFLDLDRFKHVNDSLGHHYGDRLLRQVAERLSSAVRAADTVSRHGGDEFIVLLPDPGSDEDVSQIARKLIDTIGHPFIIDGKEASLGLSIGIALHPEHGDDIDSLLRNADAALYAAKDAGRRCYRFYSATMNAHAAPRLTLANELRRALRQDELLLQYQPQFDFVSHHVLGTEALVRWTHPQRGLLAAGEFIGLAEESGLIAEIGNWVLENACRQYADWHRTGLPVGQLAVNVSSYQFRDPAFVKTVMDCLSKSGLPADRLELEVTETVIMQGSQQVLKKLHELAELGVCLAIDDFGTGYSSLNYLKLFPLDRLKIDRSFVEGLPHDASDAAIVRAIAGLGRNLELNVVAEGIETREQLEFLRAVGCHVGQGFLFARPMHAEDCEHFLRSREGSGLRIVAENPPASPNAATGRGH